jgi:hypothetical protein
MHRHAVGPRLRSRTGERLYSFVHSGIVVTFGENVACKIRIAHVCKGHRLRLQRVSMTFQCVCLLGAGLPPVFWILPPIVSHATDLKCS